MPAPRSHCRWTTERSRPWTTARLQRGWPRDFNGSAHHSATVVTTTAPGGWGMDPHNHTAVPPGGGRAVAVPRARGCVLDEPPERPPPTWRAGRTSPEGQEERAAAKAARLGISLVDVDDSNGGGGRGGRGIPDVGVMYPPPLNYALIHSNRGRRRRCERRGPRVRWRPGRPRRKFLRRHVRGGRPQRRRRGAGGGLGQRPVQRAGRRAPSRPSWGRPARLQEGHLHDPAGAAAPRAAEPAALAAGNAAAEAGRRRRRCGSRASRRRRRRGGGGEGGSQEERSVAAAGAVAERRHHGGRGKQRRLRVLHGGRCRRQPRGGHRRRRRRGGILRPAPRPHDHLQQRQCHRQYWWWCWWWWRRRRRRFQRRRKRVVSSAAAVAAVAAPSAATEPLGVVGAARGSRPRPPCTPRTATRGRRTKQLLRAAAAADGKRALAASGGAAAVSHTATHAESDASSLLPRRIADAIPVGPTHGRRQRPAAQRQRQQRPAAPRTADDRARGRLHAAAEAARLSRGYERRQAAARGAPHQGRVRCPRGLQRRGGCDGGGGATAAVARGGRSAAASALALAALGAEHNPPLPGLAARR